MSLKSAALEFAKRFKIRRDPITNRPICEKCWNMQHGTERNPVCQHPSCACLCKTKS